MKCVQYGRSDWSVYDDRGKFIAMGRTKREALSKAEGKANAR